MEDKKTILEMAKELGVSKTAIRKKMAVLFANDTENQLSETVSGIIYISVSGQKLLIEAFSHNQRKPVSSEVSGELPETGLQLSETGSQLVSSVELVIKTLQEQLSIKDSQLAEKDKQIEHLQTALAQEQAALAREQESLKLAQQLHGADKVQQALSASADGADVASADGEAAGEVAAREEVGVGHDEAAQAVGEAPTGEAARREAAGEAGEADGKRHKGFRWPWSRRD